LIVTWQCKWRTPRFPSPKIEVFFTCSLLLEHPDSCYAFNWMTKLSFKMLVIIITGFVIKNWSCVFIWNHFIRQKVKVNLALSLSVRYSKRKINLNWNTDNNPASSIKWSAVFLSDKGISDKILYPKYVWIVFIYLLEERG
jgi:hypothetical protein